MSREPMAPVDREQVCRALRRHATEFLVAVGDHGEILADTAPAELGWGPDGPGERHIADRLHPEDLMRVFDLVERTRTTQGYSERAIVRMAHPDGRWHHLEVTVFDGNAESDRIDGSIVRVHDLTAAGEVRSDADGDLGQPGTPDDSRFLPLAEALPLGILSADARGWVVYSNRAASELFGLTAAALAGSGWRSAVHIDDLPALDEATQSVIRDDAPRDVTFRIRGNSLRWVHARLVPIGDEGASGWVATVDDITERQQAQSRLAHLATHDPLTDLPNRLLLEDRLGQANARLGRGSHSITVLFIDLDSFKEVNDTFGHLIGDRVLAEVATKLRATVREGDTVARLGRDEFVLLCEALDKEEGLEVLERVRQAFEEPVDVDGRRICVGASVGLVTMTEPSTDVADLLGHADQAMYRVEEEQQRRAG